MPSRRLLAPAAAGDTARAGFQVEGRWFGIAGTPLPAGAESPAVADCSLLAHTARAHQISLLVSCLLACFLANRAGDVGLVEELGEGSEHVDFAC